MTKFLYNLCIAALFVLVQSIGVSVYFTITTWIHTNQFITGVLWLAISVAISFLLKKFVFDDLKK